MQFVFHTIEVYMVYYHVGICHIIYVVFLPQISKPQWYFTPKACLQKSSAPAIHLFLSAFQTIVK